MIEIEKYPCNDNNEAKSRERYWYEELSAKLNMKIPVITNLEEKKHLVHLYNTSEERRTYMKEYKRLKREDPNYKY